MKNTIMLIVLKKNRKFNENLKNLDSGFDKDRNQSPTSNSSCYAVHRPHASLSFVTQGPTSSRLRRS